VTHEEKLQWMARWAVMMNVQLTLQGECGVGRECVGILKNGEYPAYYWYNDETYDRVDKNGEVWTPKDAYHKSDCVAVLGRGVDAEAQLYDWLRWFDDERFSIETGPLPMDPRLGIIGVVLGKHRYARMVRPFIAEQNAAEMPRYKCHKEVWALKIKEVAGFTITPADEGYAPFDVDQAMFSRYVPVEGDYYVVYKDGYKSFSPAKAFEEGYTRL